MAGAAGALLAQTTGFASLDVLDFHRSADVLLVLVIGGIGYLYGGVIGAVAVPRDAGRAVRPRRRSTGSSGSASMLVVHRAGRATSGSARCGRARLARAARRVAGDAAMSAPVLDTRGLCQGTSAASSPRSDVSLRARARRAARADRSQRRRQDDARQPARPACSRRRPARIELDGADITRLPAHRRARRGLVRTFQINQLFARFTPLEIGGARRRGARRRAARGCWRALGARRRGRRRSGRRCWRAFTWPT